MFKRKSVSIVISFMFLVTAVLFVMPGTSQRISFATTVEYGFNIRSENGRYYEKNSEILYDLNDMPAYRLTEFSPSGYAVTELASDFFIEYTFIGQSPYGNASGRKYYLGPDSYFIEEEKGLKDAIRDVNVEKQNLLGQEMAMTDARLKIQKKTEKIAKPKTRGLTAEAATTISGVTYVDNYEYIQNMDFFGDNDYGSCGPVAMQVLLQYYDVYAPCGRHGEYLPDDLDFKTITGEDDNARQAIAEALHQDIIDRTPSIWITPHQYDTMANDWEIGLESFLENKTNITGVTVDRLGWTSTNQAETGKSLINDDKPFVQGLITHHRYAEYTYDGGSSNTDVYEFVPHAVVSYGYRTIGFGTEFICHYGWFPNVQPSADPNYNNNMSVARSAAFRRIWLSDIFYGGLVYFNEEHAAYSYTNRDSSLHNKYCYCGEFLGTGSHYRRYEKIDDNYHYRYCRDCSFRTTDSHYFVHTAYPLYNIATCIDCNHSIRYYGPITWFGQEKEIM